MPDEFDGFRVHRAGLSLLVPFQLVLPKMFKLNKASQVSARIVGTALAAALLVSLGLEAAVAQEQPLYLRDRGTGVATSMFDTYVRKGELLV